MPEKSLREYESLLKKVLSLRVSRTSIFEDVSGIRKDLARLTHLLIVEYKEEDPLSKGFSARDLDPLFTLGFKVTTRIDMIDMLLDSEDFYRKDTGEEGYKDRFMEEWALVCNRLRTYDKALQEYLRNMPTTGPSKFNSPGPAKFNWKGFRFENPDAWNDRDIEKLLDELSWLLSIFKERGVEKMLQATLTRVVLVRGERKFTDDSGKSQSEAGHYNPREKLITIRYNAMQRKSGGFLKKWLAEIFLHEIGHHVHLSLLPREAKEFWDSGWDIVNQHTEDRTRLLSIGPKDREQFFTKIEKADWDVNKAGATLKGLERLRFIAWLNNRGWTKGTKRLRLTPDAQKMLYRVTNPLEDFRASGGNYFTGDEFEEEARRYHQDGIKSMKRELGLNLVGQYPIPDKMVDQVRSEFPDVGRALDALGIPSAYGKTNVLEDFAETFVQWMIHPSRLSDTAKWRMGRTLGMSGSLGKPVMKTSLRKALVKLGSTHPQLRKNIRPVLAELEKFVI